MKKNVIIFGGTSEIATEIAKLHIKNKDNIFLAGRDVFRLAKIQSQLSKEKNQSIIKCKFFEARSSKTINDVFREAIKTYGTVNTVIIAHSVMYNFKNKFKLEKDEIKTIDVNVIGTIRIINCSLKYLNSRSKVIFLSSVASLRGRSSNYVYGASKAFVNVYLQGLQNKLFKKNINFLTVNLGPVNTRFSKEVKLRFLKANRKEVALAIFKQIISGTKQEIFVPYYWKYIMFIIQIIPNFIFNRLKF